MSLGNNYVSVSSMVEGICEHKWDAVGDNAANILSGILSNTGITKGFVKSVLSAFHDDHFSKKIGKKQFKDKFLRFGRGGGDGKIFAERVLLEDQKKMFAKNQDTRTQKIKRWTGYQVREIYKHPGFFIFNTVSLLPIPAAVAAAKGISPIYNTFSSEFSNYIQGLNNKRVGKSDRLSYDGKLSADNVVKNKSLTIDDTAILGSDIGKNISGIGGKINHKLVTLLRAEKNYRYSEKKDDKVDLNTKNSFIDLLNMDRDLTSISKLVEQLEEQLFYLKLKLIVGKIYCEDEIEEHPCRGHLNLRY
ncbi:hypothetical protein ACEV60_25595 [Enterobacter ludwigii]|uniref:hypothetical protein n=1 Tax=Enterobacter ludwigii TaxID=299767 RepID=UPI002432C9AD|nr:hypothetical protein [Enterobacter ludwigii]WGA04007.1 hypothetical protein NFK84_20410 [Enterobacter ludwigii]